VTPSGKPSVGRPQATTHAAIEAAAFTLFDQQGFDSTSVEDIARAVGVGRRTLFRYFPSKNDIPWGQFDESLHRLRDTLDAIPTSVPVLDAVHRGILEFNMLDPSVIEQHRRRMRLILTTPALQAHSVLRYEQWRRVIAEYAASRYAMDPESLLPRTIGHISLALSLAAYEQWLREPGSELTDLLSRTAPLLRAYVDDATAGLPPEPRIHRPKPTRTRGTSGASEN